MQFYISFYGKPIIQFILAKLLYSDIATADDKDHAHFFVCQILQALKEGNCFNRPRLSWPLDHGHFRGSSLAFFIGTGGREWQSKHSDSTLATMYNNKHSLPW